MGIIVVEIQMERLRTQYSRKPTPSFQKDVGAFERMIGAPATASQMETETRKAFSGGNPPGGLPQVRS